MVENASNSPKADNSALSLAKRLLPLMVQHNVDPTPANYAVWFEYLTGRNTALNKEMESLIARPGSFTPDINASLHERFAAGSGAQSVQTAALTAKNLLGEIHKLIAEFSGETTSYNEELERHVDNMTSQFDEGTADLKDMVKNIVASASTLRERGSSLNQKLEESKKEIEELRTNLATVSIEAQKDHLTGVFNRKMLDRRLEEITVQSVEEKTDLSMLLIDIDHFKLFNDKFGHLIGDEVLKIVAKSLTDSVRGKDTVARYGGEEFAVVLPLTPLAGAMIVAEAIRKAIASRDLKRRDTGESYGAINVSIGVSHYRGTDDTISMFIKRADDALYRSKKNGRNRVTAEE